MTAEREEPQKEYIITEDELVEVFAFLQNPPQCPFDVPEFTLEIEGAVRSRPAKENTGKVLEEEDVLYPIPLRENRIKIQSIAALLMNRPQKISNSSNPSYILNHVGKALSYLMRNDADGDIEYKAIKNMVELRQQQAKERER